jgi:mRNA interferase RelE/StbE
MKKYSVLFRGKAARQIKRLPPDYFRLVQIHIDRLSDDPRPPDSKKLEGGVGRSLRVGQYRVLYEIDEDAKQVIVYRVKHRREVYRR